MSDPVADMLTRLRNANSALLPDVEITHSKMKESIAGILKREGYLADYSVEGAKLKKIKIKRQQGMDITIVTNARTNQDALELLKMMGMPFAEK